MRTHTFLWVVSGLLSAPALASGTAVPLDDWTTSWLAVPDAELADLHGGVRAGDFDIAIGLRVRQQIDGREVVSHHFSTLAPAAARSRRAAARSRHAAASADAPLPEPPLESGLADVPDAAAGGPDAALPDGLPSAGPVQVLAETGETVLRSELSPDGLRISLENTASAVAIRTDVDLDVRVRNFTDVVGAAPKRAARSLAAEIGRLGVQP